MVVATFVFLVFTITYMDTISREVYLLVILILYMRLMHEGTCVRFKSVHQDRKEYLLCRS